MAHSLSLISTLPELARPLTSMARRSAPGWRDSRSNPGQSGQPRAARQIGPRHVLDVGAQTLFPRCRDIHGDRFHLGVEPIDVLGF